MWKEAAASESALPRAQEEPIASRLNEVIVSTFIRATTHAVPIEIALSTARARDRALADIQDTPIESCLSKNAETA
jgi:hypothetical protein